MLYSQACFGLLLIDYDMVNAGIEIYHTVILWESHTSRATLREI